ncbi:universal stress protein [Halomicrococcus sp. SG-WS-1]|uniref:universal stress protein n=1 Tax=Halomicrococcus sp. SG-WS-1 TaxID=3439057 RepID=UPI003F7A4656
MYERILVPLDDSEESDAVLDHALDLAEAADARVHLLSVVDEKMMARDVTEDILFDRLEAAAEDTVEAGVATAEERGIDADGEVVHGKPYREILAAAEDADLVVIGTHGRRGVDKLLLGSVSEKVVRASPTPVLLVPVGRRGE